MKLALKINASNLKENRDLYSFLNNTTVHVVISEEEKDLPKRLFKLLPDVIKSKITAITSIKIREKEYDATKTFAENNVKDGAFVEIMVSSPATEEQKQKEAMRAINPSKSAKTTKATKPTSK